MLIIKILLSVIICWCVAYAITMAIFYIDLRLNNPDTDEKIKFLKMRHLNMNKYVFLFLFILSLIKIFI